VDLAEITEGVMDTARALARGKPIQLCYQVSGDLPSITTDGRLVRRLILALLADAVKFTSEGQIRLVVIPSRDTVTISVSATGRQEPGAGESTANGLLAEHNLACQGQGGQGPLGTSSESWTSQAPVAMGRHIVERLGGHLWAGSPRLEGGDALARQQEGSAVVTFTLPIAGIKAEGLSDDTGGRN
jgi:signal transduction histidine kinase